MTWLFDAPAGVYKNHALSTRIRHEVIADVQFPKFASVEPGFGKRKGENITITRILALGLASTVSEQDKLPSGRPTIQTKAVSVDEWGFKIPWTNKEAALTHFELPSVFEQKLREQITLTQDKMCADAVKSTLIKYVPKLAGSVTLTGGSASGNVSDKNLDVNDLRDIHDYMRQTLKAPYFRNGRYIGILNTRAARGIKNDPLYESWQAPTTSEPFMTGVLKDIEGFILIESNHANSLLDLVGTSTTTGEAVFFGADAFGLLVVEEPEIRMTQPLQEDLGRFREVGWVGLLQAFLTWELAATSRAVHVTSA